MCSQAGRTSFADPYNTYSYPSKFANFQKQYSIQQGLRARALASRSVVEDFVPVDFAGDSVSRDIRNFNNNTSVQQQIIQIHRQQVAEQVKSREANNDKIEKLQQIRDLQSLSQSQERVAINILDSEIKKLQSSIRFD